MTEKTTDAIVQAQNDLLRVRRVARALGIRPKHIPLQELANIASKIDDLEESLRELKRPQVPHLAGTVLTSDYAIKVNLCIQELPSTTLVRDLKSWQYHPKHVPDWTSLMLRSSRTRNIQMGNILGHIIRSTMMEITIGHLVSNFDVSLVKGLGNQRRIFFIAAFQTVYDSDNQTLSPEEFDDQLREEFLSRQPIRKSKQEKLYLELQKNVASTVKIHDPNLRVELDLWQYASENNLLDKIIKSGIISSEESKRLIDYFEGEGRKSSLDEDLINRFSIAVARLA